MPEYTDRELMVIARGREIRDGDLVFAGMRLPGDGGPDFASLARRFVIIMPQEKHRVREPVDFITSPGFGAGWRETPTPTGAELQIVLACDPAGFWTR